MRAMNAVVGLALAVAVARSGAGQTAAPAAGSVALSLWRERSERLKIP